MLESTTERLEGALCRLALEAGDLLDDLLAQGAELPFEIEPTDEGPLPMYQYAPLTGAFIRAHVAELRRLEVFLEVRELAGEEAAVGFLVGLWDGRSEFNLIEDHLRGAIDAVLASVAASGGEGSAPGEVIVPLIGFHMPVDEIGLDGVRIVRADAVEDAPAEAIECSRPGRKGKPGFLACVRCAGAAVAPGAAVADDLRRALRTMRLFRPGAVGLAAQGWVRRPDGWERFGTGTNRPRHGGYRLTGTEAADLESFATTLADRGARMPAFEWAASRFDLGAERPSLIEALSDYLLALRGLLEGGGAARAALSARAAALVAAEMDGRERGRLCVERALSLERKLMGGSRFVPAAAWQPLDVIADLEETLRRILRAMAAGELGGDLRATADEILLSDGLAAAAGTAGAVGTGQATLGETAEWSIPDPVAEEIGVARGADAATEADEGEEETTEAAAADQATTRIVVDDVELPRLMADEIDDRRPLEGGAGLGDADWFSAADGGLEWPAFARPRRARERERPSGEARRETSDRVRYLFPVPDATDWDVGELTYEPGRSRAIDR